MDHHFRKRIIYFVTIGNLIIPKSKKIKDLCYDIELTSFDDFDERFNIKDGDSPEVQLQKLLPRRMLKVNNLTDLVIKGIEKAVKKNKLFSYRLEQHEDLTGVDWILLVGSK